MKKETKQLLSKYEHGNYNDEHRKWQGNKPHKFVLDLSQRLDFKSLNKYVALQILSIYHTWENIRKKYKKNKLKTINFNME